MKLTPREKDKLLISMAAEIARKRLNRGVAGKIKLSRSCSVDFRFYS